MIPDSQLYCDHLIRTFGLQGIPFTIRKKVVDLENSCICNVPYHLVTLTDLRSIIIWDFSEETNLSDEVKKEISVCLQNMGVHGGYLHLQDAIFQITVHPGQKPDLNRTIKPILTGYSGDIICEYSEVAESLDTYLGNLHRALSRIFYQTFGEHEQNMREQIVLSAVLHTLLTRIYLEHGIRIDDAPQDACIRHLISLGSIVPHYGTNIQNQACHDQATHSRMVQEGCNVPVPGELRITLIDPVIYIRALERLKVRAKNVKKRKKSEIAPDCSQSPLTSSPLFKCVIQEIKAKYSNISTLIDPNSGSGELLLLLLRIWTVPGDTLSTRFEKIAEHVFCADPSFSSVLITRFGLVLQGIDGDYANTELFSPWKSEIMDAIRSHVRVGSTLFSEKIQDEYYSEQEAKTAMHFFRPICSDWPDIPPEKSAVLITAPRRGIIIKNPELRQYLCKHYTSYSPGAMTALYAAEYAIAKQTGDSYVFLPASWCSDYYAVQFRTMVRAGRVRKIILENCAVNTKPSELWSCLHAGEHTHPVEIIRVREDGDTVSFKMDRTDLPEEGGWKLEDHTESILLQCLENDTVSLSEYCLGALYKPKELRSGRLEDIWISIKAQHGDLGVSSGKVPDPNADIIVKGPDEYLEGVLQSPVIRWYWKHITRTQGFVHPETLLSSLPVYQPDWFVREEKEYVSQITESLRGLSFLCQKMKYARSYHDKERIKRHLIMLEERLNTGVCSLYQIPAPFHDQLLNKEGMFKLL